MAGETSKANILIVEDNPMDARLAIMALKKCRFIESICWVDKGKKALDFLFNREYNMNNGMGMPDFVLLDLGLPDMDGMEVLKKIRKNEEFRDISIIILSGSEDGSAPVKTLAGGAKAYVAKQTANKNFIKAICSTGDAKEINRMFSDAYGLVPEVVEKPVHAESRPATDV